VDYGFNQLDKFVGRIKRPADTIGGYTGCFAKGTPVLTSNGYVAIEKLKAGDLWPPMMGVLIIIR
jgi:hypothetical protein